MSKSSIDRNVACHSLCADHLCARSELKTNVINEATTGSGVTIDGLQVIDGAFNIATPRAEYYVSSSAATTISNTTQFFPLAGTTTYSVQHPHFTHTDNKLVYTGTSRRLLFGQVAMSISSASGNRYIEFALLKNSESVPVTSTITQRFFANPAPDVGSISINFMVTMNTGDYIRVGVKNLTAATNVTAVNLNLGFVTPPTLEAADIP